MTSIGPCWFIGDRGFADSLFGKRTIGEIPAANSPAYRQAGRLQISSNVPISKRSVWRSEFEYWLLFDDWCLVIGFFSPPGPRVPSCEIVRKGLGEGGNRILFRLNVDPHSPSFSSPGGDRTDASNDDACQELLEISFLQ